MADVYTVFSISPFVSNLLITHTHTHQVLHLHAVNHALGSLEPPLDKKDLEDKEKGVLASWLNQLRLSQNAIDSILNLPAQSELANRARCVCVCVRVCVHMHECIYVFRIILPYFTSLTWSYRMKWQLIRALQMFVEHVVLKHEGMTPYLRRLQLVSTPCVPDYQHCTYTAI